jgi:hypothetical protein
MNVAFDGSIFYVAAFPLFEGQDFSTKSKRIDAAQWYIENISETDFDADAADAIEVDDREGLMYSYIHEDEDWLLVLVRFEDGTFAAVDATGTDEDTVLAIVASLSTEAAASTGRASTCTVSAAAEGTVQLRVGPGENRTSFAFLPANTEFTPRGQAEANDGSLWFQLDRAEVAPQSAAAEAVEISGDCDNLNEASAPPLVPIVPTAPPSNIDGNSSRESGEGETSPPADTGSVQGSVLPSEGTWTIRYSATGKASCLGTQTIDFPVSLPAQRVFISRFGNTVLLNLEPLTQIQPNVYSGLIDFSDGSSVRIVLTAVSASQFVGEATANITIEGTQCSATIPITVTLG